ncbi:TnsA endonuclease N-terminal domain-containing protein [Pseudoalteromonas sp. BDTF-M6]|uniref:TnsA endonuclease N-terminal domain-containing protein n=1 Tax=Pseudoalteromonas sp. BDTF-M6 TaxID=2796132 RepID=UPI001BB03D5D|nr:TnsA endonuclease N-terminal domain-containing protein [Pseudoalteromonas sp. BDTF-M6]MBS3797184.1 Tn7 transposase TnsA N-terminal domain-containing protein [Pseudoalteromonas sp. BDTF-M6]
MEAHAALLLEFDNSVVRYTSQPFTTHYQLNGRATRYTPDFLIKLASGEFKSLEIKPSNKLNTLRLTDKFAVLKQHFSEELYHPLELITDKDIYRGTNINNYQKLYGFRQLPLTPSEQARFIEIDADTVTLCELITILSNHSDTPYCDAMKLLAHDLFAWHCTKPLIGSSLLTKVGVAS